MDNNFENELNKYSNKNTKKKYFIFIFAIVILGAAIYYYYNFFNANEENIVVYNTQKVKKGDLLVSVMATGNLEPTNSVDVGIEVSGTIKEIYVDFNDEVKIGQILAKLDTTKLQSLVDSSRASLTISKANEKESLVNVNNKKLIYDRNLTMFKESNGKYPSKNELDDAKFSYESALASYESAKAKVEQAMYNLKTDEQNLQKAVVKSSINGIVLNRAVEIGQTVAASMSTPTLFTLAKDLSKMDLIVSIDEADVADIKKGLSVDFSVDAYPNEVFKGKIKQVRFNPIEVNGVITYETVVSVDNEKLLLRPGMTANAKIITKESKNEILIPNLAFRFKPKTLDEKNNKSVSIVGPRPLRQNGKQVKDSSKKDLRSIYILENNTPKKVDVRVLNSDGKFTSIKSDNIKIDDEVIISQSSSK